jgi:hypothetical protein
MNYQAEKVKEFVTVCHFHPSLTFVGEVRTLPTDWQPIGQLLSFCSLCANQMSVGQKCFDQNACNHFYIDIFHTLANLRKLKIIIYIL